MPVPPDPRRRPPVGRLAILVIIVVAIAVTVFIGYNISHYQQMENEGSSGQIGHSRPAGQPRAE